MTVEVAAAPPRPRQGPTRHPAFWTALALLAAGSIGFSALCFIEAFPAAGLELEMDREGALQAARELSERHGWGPEGFRQAVSFTEANPIVRRYVELEAGERDSLDRLREAGGYHPYRWHVRHFREGDPREVTVRFTPAGEPYGFRLIVPKDEPGASLSASEARGRAEAEAEADWGIDLGLYELAESSQVVRPGGRADHIFVYDRRNAAIAEADVRLRLGIAGDRLSDLTYTVQVPEGFSRRYLDMRAANLRLSQAAEFLFVVLFFVVGCGVGIFYLLRTRWIKWRAPLAWGGIIAGLLALSELNELPLAWMGYDTALPSSVFLIQRVVAAGILAVVGTAVLAIIFMTAEGLGRRAFPRHPQQWRFWNPEVARSGPALGRTVGGYALGAIQLGFLVAFYLWAMRRDGWWMPSEALIEPDLVASYFPWLSAVSVALVSAFWEESLFRAVPIAGAALVGTRIGGRRWWILGALLLQAAVFAAAHADSAHQPSHARLAELFLPALLWGVLYIRFGLVPVIIAHASYNLTLFSIPIWTSTAPGIWVDRVLIIVLALVPLWIVLFHIWRKGYRPELPEWARHEAWEPPADWAVPTSRARARAPSPDVAASVEPPAPVALRWARLTVLALGAAGAIFLALAIRPAPHVLPLEVDRTEAERLARTVLEGRGITLDDEWRVLVRTRGLSPSHRFVWDEGGPDAYQALLGEYVRAPGWRVRFARFTGPVEERAEELWVDLDPRGEVWRFRHRLPEAREGASLAEEEARALARATLFREFGLSADEVSGVSAVARQHPDRRDWSFTWSKGAGYPLERGDARLRIELAGAEVSDRFRFVHTPEEWERERQERETRTAMTNGISRALYWFFLATGAGAGMVALARGRFDLRASAFLGGTAVLFLALPHANGLPSVSAGFTTSRGFAEQFVTRMANAGLGLVVVAGLLALTTGLVHGWIRNANRDPGRAATVSSLSLSSIVGISLGLLVAGVRWMAVAFGPEDLPIWPSYAGAATYLPVLAPVSGPLESLITTGLLLLLVLVGLDRITHGWTRRKGLALSLLAVAGIAMPGPPVAWSTWDWLFVGGVTAAGLFLLYFISRIAGSAFVPWIVATPLGVYAARELSFGAYDGAVVGGLVAILALAVFAWAWSRMITRLEGYGPDRHSPRPAAEDDPLPSGP